MVDVLADVVLIEPYRAIRREGQVLYVCQVDRGLDLAHIFQPHMPEPGRRSSCEHENDCIVDVPPATDTEQVPRGILVKPGRAEWSDERGPLDGGCRSAQIQ